MKIQHNAKILINGPSGSGKSEFIISLLKSHLFVDNFSLVVYCTPANTTHLKSVKSMIERMKEITKDLVVFEGWFAI